MSPTWRYFRALDLAEALAHADAGGIAVLGSGQTTARLFAGTPRELMNAAEELGLPGKYLQTAARAHFDLWGEVLLQALMKCYAAEASAEAKGEP